MTPIPVSLAGSDVMKDSPFRDPKGRMPKWLEIEAELGYLVFSMKEIHKKMPKSPIHRVIDDSSGFTDSVMKETLNLAKRIVALKEALEIETGQKADTTMEKDIISVCSKHPPPMTEPSTPSANRLRFRAWQKDMEMMIYPKSFYAPEYKDDHLMEMYNPEENEFHTVYNGDDNFVLMQSTGLTDKNGKEIYEGDVVKGGIVVHNRGRATIVYDLQSYDEWEDPYPLESCEIIGNIYQDSHLIDNPDT